MDINKKIELMKNIQDSILRFLDSEGNDEENYQNLKIILDNQLIFNNKYDIISIFHILVNISNNHHRYTNFFEKIFKILDYFRDIYHTFFSNLQIYNIFSSNKRILLYLLEEKIFTIDQDIAEQMNTNYKFYFRPEIEEILNKDAKSTELPNKFYENRKIGENESELCELIRKDLIKEFIIFVNKNNLKLDLELNSS